MRDVAGILGLLVFLAIAYFAAGSYIDGIKAKVNQCTDARAALGLCAK